MNVRTQKIKEWFCVNISLEFIANVKQAFEVLSLEVIREFRDYSFVLASTLTAI